MSVAPPQVEDKEASSDSGQDEHKQSRVAKFLQHALVYGVGAISVQLVSIVLMPLYTNNFTTAEYGILTTLYKIGDVLNICLMMNGIRQASLNFWCSADDEQQQSKVPSTIALFTLCILVAGMALAFGTAPLFAQSFGLNDPLLLACGISAILLQAFTVMPLALMQARLESTAYVVTTLAILLVQLSLVIFGVLGLGWGVWGVIAALMVTYSIFGIGLTVREVMRFGVSPDLTQFRQIAKFSIPFIPTGICFFVLHNGDHFFLLKYFGAGVAGVYGVGYRLGKGVVMMAFQPLLQVWGAWMYGIAEQPDADVEFGQMYTRMLAGCMWVGLTLLIFQEEVLAILSSARFAGAATVVAPLVFAHFLLVLSHLFDSAYYVKRRTDLKPWLALAGTVVMLAAYYFLIPRYQGVGAAWATLIGFAFYAVLNLVVSNRILPIRFEYGRVIGLFALSVGIYFASVPLGLGVSQFCAKLLLWVAFPAVIWLCLVNQTERETVKGLVEQAKAFVFSR